MAIINRVYVTFDGPAFTGPAVATFYFNDGATGFQPALITLWTALGAHMPTGSGGGILGSGDQLDDATGDLVGTWTDGTDGGFGFSGGAEHAQGVGARIVWGTAGFTAGRRRRGSTFIVPLTRTAYDNNGSLTSGVLEGLQDAVDTFASAVAGDQVIWHRPVGGSGGGRSTVISSTVVDKVSWLRSRRT